MSKTKHQEGQLGLFRPDSDWVRPSALPDLRGRSYLALDTETKDGGLISKLGPGWPSNNGYLLGVSWAAEGSVGYAPIRHPDTPDNFDAAQVERWIADHCRSGVRIVMHNAPYDVGWLGAYQIPPPAHLEDTLAACVMIDENEFSYSLNECCKRAKIPGKDTALLTEAIASYGGKAGARGDIWRVPARYAGPYAEADAVATLALWHQTELQLRAQDVWDAYRTEVELIPLVVEMRRRGIRLDTQRARDTAAEFRQSSQRAMVEIGELLNLHRSANIDELRSPRQMEKWCTQEHIEFPRTAKTGQGSFTKDWMEKSSHPLPRLASRAMMFEDAASKFIDNFLLKFNNRGRIHSEIHQFRSDTGGTRSHRFSYSDPPLQQMPTPDKDPRDDRGDLIGDTAIGHKIRRCFLPEQGEAWLAADYSQQEPRLTVHFAALCGASGAEVAVERYRANPRTDYHKMVAEMTSLPRAIAKILNLSMTYGKGKRSLATELNLSMAEAEALLNDYHARLPFIKSLDELCKRLAGERGYIRLIDGARMHYPWWEGYLGYEDRAAAEAKGHKINSCTYEEAKARQQDRDHPWARTQVRRSNTRKALNNLIQGSAARQTKRAMLACWREGIVPMIQLHDELGVSVSSEEEVNRVGQIMITTTPLVVPTVVDLEVGPTWGQAKMEWAAYAAQSQKVA